MKLRKDETQKTYDEFRKTDRYKEDCFFCHWSKSVESFEFWRIVKNEYPYDEKFKESYLLCTKRHVTKWTKLNTDEREELIILLDFISRRLLRRKYDVIWGNTVADQTLAHLHLHLFIHLPNHHAKK